MCKMSVLKQRVYQVSGSWQQSLEKVLGVNVVTTTRLGGGDFATAYKAKLAGGDRLFVKTHANPPAHFFSTEAAGLQWLHETGTVRIPQVLAYSDDPPFLALQWIEPGHGDDDALLGSSLAELHRKPVAAFGRSDSRTTGSLALPNDPCDTWAEFYAERRLLPLASKARAKRALANSDCDALEAIADQLSATSIANDRPSLLHGDLWAGNRLVDDDGNSWLLDPAAHGGHREFDLSMMQLFGGYSARCFEAYHATYPLAPGFMHRVPLHQLAPLVVHAIKFGGSYKSSVRQAIHQTEKLLAE